MKRLLTGLLLIASVAVFAAPPTIKWTWATTNAPAELTNIVQAIAGTADASLPTNVVTRADTSGIIFTNTAGERITLLPSEDLGSNATVYLPGDLTPADGSISTNKLDATAIAWIDSQGDGSTSGGGYDTNEITMTAVLADTTPVPVWTNSIASNRVHYVEARLAWAGVGGTNNAEDFLVARVSRDNAGAVTIGSTNSFTAIRTAAGHDAVTLAGQNYLSLGGQQITAAAINLDTHTTGTLPEAKVHADIARDSEVTAAVAGKADTNSAVPTTVTYIQGDQYGTLTGRGVYLYETNSSGDSVLQFSLEDSTSSTLGPSMYFRGGTEYTNQPVAALTALSGYGAFKLGSVLSDNHIYTISMRGDSGQIVAGSYVGLNTSLTNADGLTIAAEIAAAVTNAGAVTPEMLTSATNISQTASAAYTDAATNAMWKINLNLYGNNWSALTNTETSTIEVYLTNSVLSWDGATLTETW